MTILCATELRPKSESALDRAGMLAARLDARLTMTRARADVSKEWRRKLAGACFHKTESCA
jgi:hypothetical protein